MSAQRRIGLTGGIATGKSTVGGCWRRPSACRCWMPTATPAIRPPAAPGRRRWPAYGGSVAGGEPVRVRDRAALARIVFADAARRAWLEALVHPPVRERFAQELRRLAGVVLMIPLLFEASLEGLCSEIWLVDCDEAQQLQRLMAGEGGGGRRSCPHRRPSSARKREADRILDNRGPAEGLPEKVRRALSEAPARGGSCYT